MPEIPVNQINGHSVIADAPPPFEQKTHDLLLKTIDRVAEEWVEQLKQVRDNSEKLEQLVLQRVVAVKNCVTQLYLLGNAAMAEAKRGDQINHQLANELLKLTEAETETPQ